MLCGRDKRQATSCYNLSAMKMLALTSLLICETPLERPEWWLVGVGIITCGFIAWQSWETKKAAQAAKKGAEAAFLNAKAVINSERAWVTVTIQKDVSTSSPITKFTNVLLNEGRTPARLKTIHIDQTSVSSPDQLPIPPRYTGVVAVPENMFVVGNNGFPIGIPFDPGFFMKPRREAVENAQEFLMFYGRLTYEDVFTVEGGDAVEHETRWCYAWVPWEGGRFVKSGPGEYNQNT